MRPPSRHSRVARVLLILCLLWHGIPGLSALSTPQGAAASGTRSDLRIGSFNIQVFGESKVQKTFIRKTLLSILSRYDIVFIMEIRDDKNQAIYQLLADLNKESGRDYNALVSKRLGRGEMKEQYAYFYDPKIVSATEGYVFDDKADDFSREPFIARFKGQGREFTFAGAHIAPTDVFRELKALNGVYRDAKARFGDNNIFLMGDFNADCIYYKPNIQGFEFFDISPSLMVSDNEDTTVSPSSCAYDRVLGFGDILSYTSQAKAFNFMQEYGYDLASSKLISDHFPVEFQIEGLGSLPENTPVPALDQPSLEEISAVLPIPIVSSEVEVVVPPTGAELACGIEPYKTPAGYCFASFAVGKTRVSASCCAGL